LTHYLLGVEDEAFTLEVDPRIEQVLNELAMLGGVWADLTIDR